MIEPRQCRDIYCIACRQRASGQGAEVVKASNVAGRGWRCAECGDRERAAITATNIAIRGASGGGL